MQQPSPKQIARFLDCFDTVCQFEAMQQAIRGASAFDKAKWPESPDPAVIAVKTWLADLAGVAATYEPL